MDGNTENRPPRAPVAMVWSAGITAVALILSAVAAGALLYSAYCQYSWVRMSLNDYGIYTNFLWNSAHGRPFRYLLDLSYLRTHPSFTLLLLAPLFRVWDDPFLLTLVHWACGMTGFWLVWRIAGRQGLPVHLRAALAFCFIGYPYAQSVLLCEFHGVCLYYILLPALYYCLAFRKGMVWLPLVLLLGLREESGLVAVPMLLFFAVKDRWKTGYVFAAGSAAYCVLAMKVLFPALSGITIGERRARLLSYASILRSFGPTGLKRRAAAVGLLFLPALPFLFRRAAAAILVFPLAALLVLQASPLGYHHELKRHYPAAVFTGLVLGIIHSTRRRPEDRAAPAPRTSGLAASAYLIGVTVATHFAAGSLPYGGRTDAYYIRPNPLGRQTRAAARHVPKEGVLLTTPKLTGYTANRADLLVDFALKGREDLVDVVFLATKFLFSPGGAGWLDRVRAGEFGATYFDQYYAVLQRGAPTTLNGVVLDAASNIHRTVIFPRTASHHGMNRYVPGFGLCRYWNGDGGRAPANLVHGSSVELPAGRYAATFRLSARPPERDVRGTWGRVALYPMGSSQALVEDEIEHVPGDAGGFREQVLRFSIERDTPVEPRITAGDAELMLDRVVFRPETGG